MDSTFSTPPVKKLFSFLGNEDTVEELAKTHNVFAYPDLNLVLVEGKTYADVMKIANKFV